MTSSISFASAYRRKLTHSAVPRFPHRNPPDGFLAAVRLTLTLRWFAAGAPESESFASTLLNIFETTVAERVQEYDILGNSPATYFICGVWANMKRGREFHPASNGITVTYGQPDAYGNQNIGILQ